MDSLLPALVRLRLKVTISSSYKDDRPFKREEAFHRAALAHDLRMNVNLLDLKRQNGALEPNMNEPFCASCVPAILFSARRWSGLNRAGGVHGGEVSCLSSGTERFWSR